MATICLMRPASRRARPASTIAISFLVQIVVVEHAASRADSSSTSGRPATSRSQASSTSVTCCVRRRATSATDDLGPPVQVLIAGLGRGDREPPAQLGHDRPDHRPLLLQRMHVAEQQVTPQACPTTQRRQQTSCSTERSEPCDSDPRLLPHLERLDHVVDLDVVERPEPDTALEARRGPRSRRP